MSTRRECLTNLPLHEATHAGLLLRYFAEVLDPNDARLPDARRELLLGARDAVTRVSGGIYGKAFERWKNSLAGCVSATYRTRGRLTIGLGRESVLETGVTLHHTYGVPVLPGTGLKGLCAHYCESEWGRERNNEEFEPGGKLYDVLFGSAKAAGFVNFFDAWMLPESTGRMGGLMLDVITPHHQGWNTAIGNAEKAQVQLGPSDGDDPVPVTWLSVSGQFLVSFSVDLAPDDEQKPELERLVSTLLFSALDEWGVGGKTSSGYGRMFLPKAK
jgi:CRISPR-associated protein Cmr6